MPGHVIAVLHNLSDAFLGFAGPALRSSGASLDERRLLDGDPLPAVDEADGIVSLGGEQSVRDIDRDPLLAAEAELLRDAAVRGVPVLGVCLGAQLLAHALGGSVARLPGRMIEWAPIEPLAGAADDPVLGSLPAGAMALHWNEDGFEPPPGAVELLRRPGSSGEGFRVGDRAWGVQFHPEIDPENLEGWYQLGYLELSEADVTEEQARAADALHLPGQRALSEALFGGFARVVGGASSRVNDYPHRLAIPTRWHDNDVYGHVNNVEYYAFFDTVINAYLIREGGLDIHSGDVIGLCVESHCEFHAPVVFPETVTAGLRVSRSGRSSVRYEIGLFGEGAHEPAATGWFVHVFVDRAARRPAEIPAGVRAALDAISVRSS